jgi:hypothetical protein
MKAARYVLTFRVDEDLAKEIRQAARREGRYLSSYLRLLVSQALDSRCEPGR